jgi:transcriptional regulator with XRE-family HTH domain
MKPFPSMKKTNLEDPIMAIVRQRFEASGMTHQELGEKMGYAAASARQSVSQFFKGGDPRVGTIRRFAKALEIPLCQLFK